jgi:5-methylcytosine-specific restriction protein B
MANIWWVNQGATYDAESSGGYIWAPQKTKKGNAVEHHVNVSRVAPGDVVVHYENGRIRALGMVEENLGTHDRPSELPSEQWEQKGYLARVKYHELETPIPIDEVPSRTPAAGPFNRTGGVNQGYLFRLSGAFASVLYTTFRDRWPLEWLAAADPWDEYIAWAKRCVEWPGFDAAERDYKEALGQRLEQARSAFVRGDDDWRLLLRKALQWQENNLTAWQVRDVFLKWIDKNPERAHLALGALWRDDASPTEDGVTSFVNALAEIGGVAGKITIASVLLMAIDPHLYPPYRQRAFEKSYGLTGFEGPPGGASAGAIWGAAMEFLDEVIAQARKRGTVLRDRLDAQGIVWMFRGDEPPQDWPDEEKERFRIFVGIETGTDDDDEREDLEVTDDTRPTLADLAQELLIDEEQLRLIEELLEHKRQVIFYGPPGTGKTYIAKRLAEYFAGGGGGVEKVQFHPSYSYEDFVEGFRPKLDSGQVSFELKHGPLRRVADDAAKAPSSRFMLLIDEINRGNTAKVFGELYYLLEYRNEKISLLYSSDAMSLPDNLWIIGTMNTADRSIALVDGALRRRFHFVPFFPDQPPIQGLLRRWLTRQKPELVWVADLVDRANKELGSTHQAIGPSHFLRSDLTEQWVRRIWEYSVQPYIAEQLFGDDARLEKFSFDNLRQAIAASE